MRTRVHMTLKIKPPISIFAILICTSCNVNKLVKKGDALYTGASVKVADSTLSNKEKKSVVEKTEGLPRPKPNSKFLGIPVKLDLYSLSGDPKKGGFIRKFFRKIGEPPVLLSTVKLDYNVKLIQNYLENIGYFHAEVNGDTTVKHKKAHATYTLTPGPVYTINEVSFSVDSSSLGKTILKTKSNSFLHPGDAFNLDIIKGERERIDAILKEQGYYYFSPDALIIEYDSTIGNHKVNLYVKVKEQTPVIAKKPYIIDNVYIYPTYRLNANRADTANNEKYLYEGYYIVDPRKKFKPQLFPNIMRFDSGDVYNRTDHNLTLSRLINLNVFKFVKNRFENSPNSESDTGRLNTFYYLTPSPKKSLRAELSGNTKSNNYIGSLITVTFSNRNTFKGAERLDVHANVGTEVQYSGYQSGYNTYNFGAGATLTIPKFVTPIFKFNTTNAYVPSTKISLSYDLLNRRKLYTLSSVLGELGYSWKQNIKTTQVFDPISINYVKALDVTQLYLDSIAKNPVLKHSIDTQFIVGSNYSYSIDQLANKPEGTGFYFNGLVDLSGNIAGIIVKPGSDGAKRIFNTPFSQYIKAQTDFRYYYAINSKLRSASRVILGFGYPYGNNTQLPFIKQFFIGGNNSVRAFRSRSIGPGTYRDPNADSLNFLPDQSGDIKLELNTELRYKINSIVEGAFFVDAGNIWLYNKDPDRPGAQFTKDFFNQLAAGTGIGLRFNLSILLLRLDLAMPIREPWLPQGQRWILDQVDFGSSEWRKRNLVFNLAIGYPF